MSQSQLEEAFSRLNALKTNLPDRYYADQTYIEEFHAILDLLERVSGVNLTAFRVPNAEIRKEVSGGNYLSGETYYSGRMVCDRSLIMMKLDGVLLLFSLKAKKTTIGFRLPS